MVGHIERYCTRAMPHTLTGHCNRAMPMMCDALGCGGLRLSIDSGGVHTHGLCCFPCHHSPDNDGNAGEDGANPPGKVGNLAD